MTTCRSDRLRLAAYADDELDVGAAAEVAAHLADCAACRVAVDAQRSLTRALRDHYPQPEAPPDLADRVRAALFGRARPARWVAAAAIALLTGSLATLSLRHPDRSTAPAIVVAAARAHGRANAGELTLALRSADLRDVDAWLSRALPFPASLPNAPSPAIRVEGASELELGGESAGLVRYRFGEHPASLFLLAHPAWGERGRVVRLRGMTFRIFEEEGSSLVAWSHPPLSYLLVSDGAASLGEACGVCHGTGRQPMTDFAAALAASGA